MNDPAYRNYFSMRYSIFFLFAFLGAVPGASGSSKPNIIYILLDDAGFGDLSCYGQTMFETPHIDRLAREGMKFTNQFFYVENTRSL